MAPESRRYANIQALRAVAALLVVFGHTLDHHFDFGLPVLAEVSRWIGYSGVDMFFVISGFVIALVVSRMPTEQGWRRLQGVGLFLARRAIRIYPIYWIVLAVVVLGLQRLFTIADFRVWLPHHDMLINVLLLASSNEYLPQAWSMGFEVLFYGLVAGALLAAPRRFFLIVAIVIGGWSAYACAQPPVPFANPMALEFLFGIAAAAGLAGGRPRPRLALWAGGLLYALGAGLTARSPGLLGESLRVATFGVGAAGLVYGLAAAERLGLWVAGPVLGRLGDASYSIYLWHLAVLWTAKWAFGSAAIVPGLLRWFAVLGLIVGGGLASYRWLERPLIMALNGGLRALSMRLPAKAGLSLSEET